MTDWCLVETLREVCYGSSSNVVRWRNVPKIVILNVPEEVELTKTEILPILEGDNLHGPRSFSSLYQDIAGNGLTGSPPKYYLVKLGGDLPDKEMKTHITENHVYELRVYDWLVENNAYQKNDGPDPYRPHVKHEFDFYSRYDILPHSGWKVWWDLVAMEEAKKQTPQGT